MIGASNVVRAASGKASNNMSFSDMRKVRLAPGSELVTWRVITGKRAKVKKEGMTLKAFTHL